MNQTVRFSVIEGKIHRSTLIRVHSVQTSLLNTSYALWRVVLSSLARPWFTSYMFDPQASAQTALEEAAEVVTAAGLVTRLRTVVAEVWQANLARYEPDELGDDAQTLGGTCARNIANRVERLVRANSEFETQPWEVSGLTVARPSGALRLEYFGRHFHIMKSPMVHGRSPKWDAFPHWNTSSDVREEAARANTRALSGFRTAAPGQTPLTGWPASYEAVALPHFVFVWAAELTSPATSGWLGVPCLGEQPFVAIRALWSDPENGGPSGIRRSLPTGPSFDELDSEVPNLKLKTRPEGVGEV